MKLVLRLYDGNTEVSSVPVSADEVKFISKTLGDDLSVRESKIFCVAHAKFWGLFGTMSAIALIVLMKGGF